MENREHREPKIAGTLVWVFTQLYPPFVQLSMALATLTSKSHSDAQEFGSAAPDPMGNVFIKCPGEEDVTAKSATEEDGV